MKPQIFEKAAVGSASFDPHEDIFPIDAAYFYAGMRTDFAIYARSKKSPELLLICDNERLNGSVIDKMDMMEASGNFICVSKENYKKIILNAAAAASANGITVDWDVIHETAENPQTCEEIINRAAGKRSPHNASKDSMLQLAGLDQEEEQTASDQTDGRPDVKADGLSAREVTDSAGESHGEDSLFPSAHLEFNAAAFANKWFNPEVLAQTQREGADVTPDGDNASDGDSGTDAIAANAGDDTGDRDTATADSISRSQERLHEIRSAATRLKEYMSVTDLIRKIITSASKNYVVNLSDVNAAAGAIVEIVRSSSPEITMQCTNSLTGRTEYLISHSQNVAALNVLLAEWLGLPARDMQPLAVTGIMHDTGKLIISNKIINKPDRLSADEFEAIKKHPVHSYNIAVSSGITNENILMGIRNHHEKINGSGYPDGLNTAKISPYASITAISDIYDAMVSKRTYREDLSPFDVMDELSRLRLRDLNVRIVDTVLDNMTEVLTGKQVILSNGKTARIAGIDKYDYANPAVYIDDKYIKTSNELKVLAVANFIHI